MIVKTSFSISLTVEEKSEINSQVRKGIESGDLYGLFNHIELMLQNAYCNGVGDKEKSEDREIPV